MQEFWDQKGIPKHRITHGLLKDGQESSGKSKIYKENSVNIYSKAKLKLSVAMPNSGLHTNLLNIFIFEAIVSLQTLLQALKQNSNKSAKLGTFCSKFSFFLSVEICQNSTKIICSYAQQ